MLELNTDIAAMAAWQTHTQRPAAQRSDTGHPSLNNPMLALLRSPRLPERGELMAGAWTEYSAPQAPSPATLIDAIKVQHAIGSLSPTKAQWLAENKTTPLLLWMGVEQEFTDSLTIPASSGTGIDAAKALIGLLNLPAIARWMGQWAKQDRSLIPDAAIRQCHGLMHVTQGTHNQAYCPDLRTFKSDIEAAQQAVCTLLNEHMERQERSDKRNLTPVSFVSSLAANNGFDHFAMIGAGNLEGADLSFEADDLDQETLEALKGAIHQIDAHLHPLMTPFDMLDRMYFEEEIEAEIETIHSYLDADDLDYTEDNIEQAIANSDLCCIEDFECYEEQSSKVQIRHITCEDWKPGESTELSADELKAQTLALAPTDCGLSTAVREWVVKAMADLQELNARLPLDSSLDHLQVRHLCEYLLVFPGSNSVVTECAEMLHECQMQGDCEDEAMAFDWSTTPAQLMGLAERLGLGSRLIQDLIFLEEK